MENNEILENLQEKIIKLNKILEKIRIENNGEVTQEYLQTREKYFNKISVLRKRQLKIISCETTRLLSNMKDIVSDSNYGLKNYLINTNEILLKKYRSIREIAIKDIDKNIAELETKIKEDIFYKNIVCEENVICELKFEDEK